MPVVFFDPTQPGLNVLPLGRVGISDPAALSTYARVFGLPCAGWPQTTLGLVTHSTQMVQKGSMLEAQRTPIRFIPSVTIDAAGDNIVWDPAAGTRFRLMGGILSLTSDITTAAQLIMTILDAAAPILRFWISEGAIAAAPGHPTIIPFTLPNNGYLSAAINQNLILNLTTALTVGSCGLNVYGTEEV